MSSTDSSISSPLKKNLWKVKEHLSTVGRQGEMLQWVGCRRSRRLVLRSWGWRTLKPPSRGSRCRIYEAPRLFVLRQRQLVSFLGPWGLWPLRVNWRSRRSRSCWTRWRRTWSTLKSWSILHWKDKREGLVNIYYNLTQIPFKLLIFSYLC